MAERTEDERAKLKAFLFKAVSVQTDAEPQLLADYLFALIENNAQISSDALSQEISEFVDTDAPQLAQTVYSAIHSKSYLSNLPAAAGPSSTPNSKAIPTGPASAGKKRRLSDSGDVEMADGNKITRFNDAEQGAGPGGRIGGDDRMMGNDAGRGRRGRGGAMLGNGMEGRPRPKQLCFDYHNKGFCARGVQCRYEHGPDTMYSMPGGGMPPMPFPFMMPFPPNGAGPGGPGPAGPGGPAPPQQEGAATASENSMQVDGAAKTAGNQEYSPDQPGMAGPMGPFPGMGSPNGAGPFPFPPGGPPPPGMMEFMMGMPGMFPPFDQGGARGNGRGRGRGGRGGRGGRNGPEGFNDWDGDLSTRPPKDNTSTTLVVADIPAEHLNLEAIHNQFKQFGTVTNVAVETRAKKALVAFSTNREAHSAWLSKESFFGDRHVKVLWHRPREGQGEVGQKALNDSAPLLENLRKIDQEGVEAFQSAGKSASTSALPTVDPEIKAQLAGVRERGLQLEKIVAEQKVLMVRLEGTKDAEEKNKLKTRLKELIGESSVIKKANAGIDVDKLQGIIEAQTKAREEALKAKQQAARVQSRPQDGVHSIQEMLDHEMEEHSIKAQLEDSKDKKDEEVDEETLKLRAQLAALKNQASSMGINPDASVYQPRGGYRGGRGRGARGGATGVNRSLKLDNRPKSLAITGQAVRDDAVETIKQVKEWYADLSDVTVGEPVVREDKVVVTFSNRGSAETAMAMGTTIPGVTPPVSVGWHTAPIPEVPVGAPAPGMEGIEPTVTVKQEVEVTRGERDADE